MRAARIAALAVLVAMLVAWHQAPAESRGLPSGPANLSFSERHVQGGAMYIEGAIQVVRIRRGAASSGERQVPLKLRVRRGRYVVWSAARPCDGNCSYLDPPRDTCRATVTAPAKVVIVTRVGQPCRIRVQP